ncbi:hypothetical protein BIFGAL_04370 [Bifidobacterium gallicum DSM 20093 = LMG 11596]|uniref:Uncharacterized protein n=1 Tax=Bifidobacterium gallicum DSM 20093 = LMG 11596 TaxID=561180 RepID=D1NWW3_9BIFI|nr:hypothetical protein BIFGAL_04370 [Bifidobacterium gallicum DSM 20093 = LMG 11596]KFI59037.1 hypothetical protein BGLCM_0621 [Bifidobacterium gallicum DSM 20093 = LMG 11596]
MPESRLRLRVIMLATIMMMPATAARSMIVKTVRILAPVAAAARG